MIVQTHSPEQVVREAFRDLPAMWNKLKQPIERLQRRMRVDKSVLMVPQLHEYRASDRDPLQFTGPDRLAQHRAPVPDLG